MSFLCVYRVGRITFVDNRSRAVELCGIGILVLFDFSSLYLVLAVVYIYISCDIYHSAGDVVGGCFGSDGVAAIVDSSSRVEIGSVRNSVIVENIRFYGLFRVGEDYISPCDSTLGVTVILDFSRGD